MLRQENPCYCAVFTVPRATMRRVQFWQTENIWRLDRSCRGCCRRIIPRLVDATGLCPVTAAGTRHQLVTKARPFLALFEAV